MTPEDWAATQAEIARLRDVERQTQAAIEAAEAKRLQALAEKGQIEEAMTGLRTTYEAKVQAESAKASAIELQWLAEKKNAAIARALAGRTFAGTDPAATATMVAKLLSDEIEAARDSTGNPIVRDRVTLRPADSYLAERLNSPEFAVFFAASTRGGAGGDGTRPAAATPNQESNYDAWARRFREQMDAFRQARVPQ